ncbi:DUF4097 family beta strand repeat-containing protein [Kitasatospora sp. LaBMicrA B282]|uniref:DUF4097 family beta strand repeat-containing protein n=1 Tax=Kitasatospora sp. LaBMicrA B282 TaxID=3420949 RepID=UPI003D119EB0
MHTFTTPAPISTVLDIPAGHIRFIATDRVDTTVEVRPVDTGKSRDVQAAEQTTVAYTDGILLIEAASAKNRILGSSGSVEVTVQLPAGSRVEAKAASADLRGVGRLGDVTFEAARATVELDEVAGVRVALQLGDVTIGRLGGDAHVTTQKGDLTITEATRGTVTLHTKLGDVQIGAARGTSASLDANTGLGSIRNSLDNTGGSATGLTIHATTGLGDITGRSL